MYINQKERTAEFYEIVFTEQEQISIGSLYQNNISAEDFWRDLISKDVESKINDGQLYENDNNFIEFISIEKGFVFGVLGKSTSVEKGVLKRIKNITGEEFEKTEYLEEYIRYFILKLDDFRISIIRNSQAPNLKKLICDYLSSLNNKLFYDCLIRVLPISDANINQKLDELIELTSVYAVFKRDSDLAVQMIKPKYAFDISQNNIEKINLSIKCKNQPLSERFKKFLKNHKNLNDLDKLEISGKNGEQTEILEFVEQNLTKKIALNLTEEQLKNGSIYLDEIKQALIRSFYQNNK